MGDIISFCQKDEQTDALNFEKTFQRVIYLVGKNEMDESEINELYRNQNRRRLGAPAPPGGLYMMRVMY